ncbi:MAG: ORF6N domain-containing protein [Ruminococcus sp.]|nr:ORF6N domain-containing protein [Ruminococcus sp.]
MNEVIEKDKIIIENMIYEIRGKQVMLDRDLANLYKCANGTKSLNLAVKRHINRFPERYMFQLSMEEWNNLRFQIETTNSNMNRTLPYVFTEEGVAMLATILKTSIAENSDNGCFCINATLY